MTKTDCARIETDGISAFFALPNSGDERAAAREYSAAQLRFIAKAFEQMEERSKHEEAERADKR